MEDAHDLCTLLTEDSCSYTALQLQTQFDHLFGTFKKQEEDRERLILHRGTHAFVVMNKFPYANGHLLVCPYRHVMALADLTREEAHDVMDIMQTCMPILQKHFHCEGINVGLNQGEAAGAGIREHLHFHLVPRWNGDSSFMAVLDEVRTIPQHLLETYDALTPLFREAFKHNAHS